MSGYHVFQAHDGIAAEELCIELPRIALLVLNTTGTGLANAELIRRVRANKPGMTVLHIGLEESSALPADVPTLIEPFTPGQLLQEVDALVYQQGGV